MLTSPHGMALPGAETADFRQKRYENHSRLNERIALLATVEYIGRACFFECRVQYP